ncbi:MAG: hypothetical protein DI598_03295 [Pseudopedobacter saltans]|uniref:DUF4890 domain-containing protein n=1 Tax=Pseudopedobacter saltans TaxID=151895 RepID=A0A2W5F5T6_9SPHI|nr:MAG: hypothetical protein DI598_03295 [Pseudopedobacter saltans]
MMTSCVLLANNSTFAQSKKEKEKKAKENEANQLVNIREGYKRMFIDSLNLTPAIADTAAAIEVESIKKLNDVNKVKKQDQDEKDFQIGMINEQKDNRLRMILPREAFDKYAVMQKRWKDEREAQQKAAKDAQNSQPINRGYRGGYGGYGGYGGGYGRY